MKRHLVLLALLPLLFSSCVTRIVTVADHPVAHGTYIPAPLPATGIVGSYTTTVTTPKTRTVTTAQVTAIGEDISLYLDLKAVAAAFAQSATVREFEMLLNDGQYMLNNLDLNGDGYVDYLRVIETLEGYNHVFLIQAVLAANVYQDVATLVAEVTSTTTAYVQVIGAPYIYGPKYIVQPVFVVTPHIYAHFLSHGYQPWKSPWYWDHFPSCYHRPAPIYLNHYQAYVRTYMSNHHYCHEVTYPDRYHYPDYDRVSRPNQRNDYGQQHPERTFTVRNANLPAAGNTRAANAYDVSVRRAANTTTTTTSRQAATTTTRQATSSTSSTSATRQATSTSTTTAPRQTTSTTTATPRQATSSTSSTTAARQATSSSTTRIATPSTTTSRTGTTTRQTTTTSAPRQATTSATTSSPSRAQSVQGTMSSRVSNSGTATTTRSGASATRSSSTTSAPRSASTSSATRSAATSTSTRR
ncbi:MAG: hypothetical protein MJZ92_05575 [Paludibacteraceae bacterium]|nr:hypothetical protein [Paludibacteraceae bacterium]